MPYDFKLEALRRYREFEEERAQKEMADGQRLLDEARDQLTSLIDLQAETETAFVQHQKKSGNPSQAAMYRGYLQHLSSDIERQRRKTKEAERQFEEKRQALLEAMKKRKALDRLKEKGEQAFNAENDREEEKFINEMAINRYMLKKR